MWRFSVFGFGFSLACATCGYDFLCAGYHVGNLECQSGPGFIAFTSPMDGYESPGDSKFSNMRIMTDLGCPKAISIKANRS